MTPTHPTPPSPRRPRPLQRGILVPIPTFFKSDDTEKVDLQTLREHVRWVASAAVMGLVVLGSSGEGVSLTNDEAEQVVTTCREELDEAGLISMPIVAGASGQSLVTALSAIGSVHKAGADYALVLPSSYYHQHIGETGARNYYERLADRAPMPILIYSYPGVTAGMDLSAELISDLAEHPNIRGIKHTDHDISKIGRTAAGCAMDKQGKRFLVYAGASDYLIGAMSIGAHGAISAMANLAPRTVLACFDLWDARQRDRALEVQRILSSAEWELTKGGVPMLKALLEAYRGYGGKPRLPLVPTELGEGKSVRAPFEQLMQLERQCTAQPRDDARIGEQISTMTMPTTTTTEEGDEEADEEQLKESKRRLEHANKELAAARQALRNADSHR